MAKRIWNSGVLLGVGNPIREHAEQFETDLRSIVTPLNEYFPHMDFDVQRQEKCVGVQIKYKEGFENQLEQEYIKGHKKGFDAGAIIGVIGTGILFGLFYLIEMFI